MDSDRTRKNALAFLDAFAHSTGADRPRPLNYLAISNMQLLGIKLGGGKEALAGLGRLELRDQVNAFIWLQCAPLPLVSRGIRRHEKLLAAHEGDAQTAFEDFMVEVVEPWIATVPAESLEHALDQLTKLDEIDAASVTAEPPADLKPDRPDPN
jgi:hypothetical protein